MSKLSDTKTTQLFKMKGIDTEKFYTVKEIAEMGWIKTSSQRGKRDMILRLIRSGKLKAINLEGKNRNRYIVKGEEILNFLKKNQ
ncbi:MAG: hypothetical protein KAS32_00025 [Candidatus Peribacteraceae bacterium]|nr:hypothetical protein [Candidatus Peribacteraceae bacterium]